MLADHKGWQNYKKYLRAVASLSRLFSDAEVPYLHYRTMENIFCHALGGKNLARGDIAYDAVITQRHRKIGVGLKTFRLPTSSKTEKIAEFNKLSNKLKNENSRPEQLIMNLSEQRNKRINFANQTHGISEGIYHCAGRRNGQLYLFQLPYSSIQTAEIRDIKQTSASISFTDNLN